MFADNDIAHDPEFDSLSARFARDGVVWTPRLLPDDEVADVRRNIDRYISRLVSTLPDRLIRLEADGIAIRSLYFMDQIDDYFRDFGNLALFRELVKEVVGYEMQLLCVETFNKAAGLGSAAPPHQDAAFLTKIPIEVVSLWISLDYASKDNGAVRYWPGSHRNGLLPHVEHQYGLQADPSFVDYEADLLVSDIEPGAAALHSGLVLHDSPANASEHSRLGIVCVYQAPKTHADTA